MSSERRVRIPSTEYLRFLRKARPLIKSGPKPRPIGIGDGQQVEIPLPVLIV